MTELICTLCPSGCRLSVSGDLTVTGNGCPKGIEYGKNEVTNPVRTLTTTVRLTNTTAARLPVKTDRPIPKSALLDCMKEKNKITAAAPVAMGQIIAENIGKTGADLIATRSIK